MDENECTPSKYFINITNLPISHFLTLIMRNMTYLKRNKNINIYDLIENKHKNKNPVYRS